MIYISASQKLSRVADLTGSALLYVIRYAFHLYVTSMYLRYRIHSLSNIFKTEKGIKPLFIYLYTLCYSVINIADVVL